MTIQSVPPSLVADPASLVEPTVNRQVRNVASVGRNSAFLLVALVYLVRSSPTTPGSVYFGVLAVWALWRLITRRETAAITAIDVAFVAIGALLEPAIVDATMLDMSMISTHAIVYPTIVGLGVVERQRVSLAITLALTAVAAVGDTYLLGSPSITLLAYPLSWAAAAWVHGLIHRAAVYTDIADALARTARMREVVAAARIRFERDQFATLHDTAASTLLMIGESPGLDRARVAAQAERDIEILSRSSEIVDTSEPVDIGAQIATVSGEARVSVDVWQPDPVSAPGGVAAAVTKATREALNNIDRHARARVAWIGVEPGRITIRDNGIGFNEDRRGFGLMHSIEDRMRRAGGAATITSIPDLGTTIELTWRDEPPEPIPSPDEASRVTRSFHYGMAAAHFLVCFEVVIIGFGGHLNTVEPISTVTIALLFLSTVVIVFLVEHRLAWLRWSWIGVLLLLGGIHALLVAPDQLTSPQNWVSISVGWALVAQMSPCITSSRRAIVASSLIVGYWVVTGLVRLWRVPTGEMLAYVGYGVAAVSTMQVSAMCCAWFIAESVRIAEAHGEEQYAAATSRAIREAVQQDYRRRFATLTADIVGFLSGVTSGGNSLTEPLVIARARSEYARLRRLFAQAQSYDHPLIERLRPVVDVAADRGVHVSLDISSRPPDLLEEDVATVGSALETLISTASSRIRMVVSSTETETTVSVVTDCTDEGRTAIESSLNDRGLTMTVDGPVTWLRVPLRAATKIG